MIQPIKHAVRCFRRLTKGKLRHGLWIMTRPSGRRGLFVHGDRDEREASAYTVEDLERLASEDSFLPIEEIALIEALSELDNWPEAQKQVIAVFRRHIVGADIGHLARLKLEPGDILVVGLQNFLDDESHLKRLTALMEAHFPGHKVVIMEGGATLGAVRPVKATEAAKT